MKVIGVDAAEKMLEVARNKNKDIDFVLANILESLPFDDNHFEIAITSYVAHGLKPEKENKCTLK